MNLRLANGRPVLIGRPELGGGAEGRVFPVADSDSVCVKLYLRPSSEIMDRVQALTAQEPVAWRGDHPSHLHLAWPRAVVWDERGQARGFAMHRADGFPWRRLLDPGRRMTLLDEPSWRTSLSIAARLARLVGRLHQISIVIADISPRNVVVDRRGCVTLIDCDTVSFTDGRTGRRYEASKFTPEYAAPEVLSAGLAAVSRHSDTFALAIMIIELLMEGTHPFEGVPADGTTAIGAGDNIRFRNNRITHPERLVRSASDLPVELLPSSILPLARRCFGPGHDDPTCRPTAREWENALNLAAYELMGCRHNAWHSYPRTVSPCPWCTRRDRGFGEHFPDPETGAAADPAAAGTAGPIVPAGAAAPLTAGMAIAPPPAADPVPASSPPSRLRLGVGLRPATGRCWFTLARLGMVGGLCLAAGALCWALFS